MFTLEESAQLGFMLRAIRVLVIAALVIGCAWMAMRVRRAHRAETAAVVSSGR